MGIFTGGLLGELLVKAMYIMERQGKYLKAAFERNMTAYANSKGAIARFDYLLDGDKKKKYSMRFYGKDLVWRVLNLSD